MTLSLTRPDMLARLLLVGSIAPVTSVSDLAHRLPVFSDGQRFLATVEAQLANGNFRVQVNGHALQMNLPQSARPGDRMELILIAREPRLTFLLLNDGQSRASAGATLSATGRFLGALALDAAKSPVAPSLTGAAPVLGGPPADSRQLPGLLREALSQSGLFYESHQAQWVAGTRSLAQLLLEPQGALSSAALPQLNTAIEAPQPNMISEPEAAATGAVRNSDAPVHEQAGPPTEGRQLPGLPQRALSQSGLLYESHHAQWATGKPGLGQSLQETQGALASAASSQLNSLIEELQPNVNSEPGAAATGALRNSDASVHEQTGPPSDRSQLPGLPRQALSQSGLFYESHDAQRVAGNPSLGQWLQEPQGALASAVSSQLKSEIEAPQSNIISESEAAAAGSVRNSDAPVHEQTVTLVQQQLSTLETGLISWRGEIWPGQWMEWDIAEHSRAETEIADPMRWQTRLRLTLPRLGEVAATLAFDSGGVHVALGAAAAETAELLQCSQLPLTAAMAAAGLSVVAMAVRHDAGR